MSVNKIMVCKATNQKEYFYVGGMSHVCQQLGPEAEKKPRGPKADPGVPKPSRMLRGRSVTLPVWNAAVRKLKTRIPRSIMYLQ